MNIEEKEKVLWNLISGDTSSLFKQKREFEYAYCIWGTSVLFEIYPFDLERKHIKRGRKITKTPSKKSGKFQHFLDREDKVIAIYGYTDNYDLPAQYIFFEYHSSEVKVYCFNIVEQIDYIQCSIVKNGKMLSMLNMDSKGNYIAEEYHYDEYNHIVSIDRKHKDPSLFKNTDFFPNNLYKSRFSLKYSHDSLTQIKWNANAENKMKVIFPF
ncbi:hypothetical protein [Alloprevotella tannerae]